MKFSQIAICMPDHEAGSANFKDIFGSKMYTDKLKLFGMLSGAPVSGVDLTLSFDHSIIDGCELEYIYSESECHWHKKRLEENGNQPFLSHLGVYCTLSEFQEYFDLLLGMDMELLQLTSSYDHSNKRKGDRKISSRAYKDAIFNTEEYIGFNIKLSCKEV